MADSREDIASQALARLGEPAISDFDEDTETAEKVNQLYEPTILHLLSIYPWQWAKNRAALSVDGGKTPTNEWTRAFALPTQKTDLVGQVLKVWNSTNVNAAAFFNYDIENRWLFTNATTIVVEYIQRRDESEWPGYFERFASEALAAALAMPITEIQAKEEHHLRLAWGSDMESGLFGAAKSSDERSHPTTGFLDDNDPMFLARFGGNTRNDGVW